MAGEPEELSLPEWFRDPDLTLVSNWAAIAVTGVIYAPVIPLGLGPDLHLVPASFLEIEPTFKKALAESFHSFGLAEVQCDATVALPQFLLFAISDCSETVVKNAMAICDTLHR